MRTLILTSVAVMTLAACSEGEKSKAPDAASASASAEAGAAIPAGPVTREQVYASQDDGPEAFVRTLYAQYVNGGPQGAPPEPGRDPLLTRILNALVGADVRAANGAVATLNYDPFCACQDQGDFVVNATAVAQSDPNNAEATVTFTNMGRQKTLKLKLLREGPNWKVADVIDGTTSLHDTLMAVAVAAG